MSTAFRSSSPVTNGAAGTTVTVAKPAGIVDTGTNPQRDQLIAYIAAEGAPTITPPAGWTLVTSAIDAGNTVTLWCYRKLASSEGASWTWTLGSSHRNWGWVGAYTGVDPTTPLASTSTSAILTSSTILATGSFSSTLPPSGQGVAAGAAVRAATGTATTWTHENTERADLSTNGGTGVDVAGVVGDVSYSGFETAIYAPTMTASQAQTAGAAIGITLTPYSAPYTGARGATGLVLEAAFGADPDTDSTTWSWTDVSAYLHNPGKVSLFHGRANRTAVADPSRMEFTLLNLNGEFTGATGTFTASMVRNLPFRVRLTGFGTGNYHRGTAFLASMRPRWDLSTNFAVVDIVAQGRLRRTQQRTIPLRSAAYRSIIGLGQPAYTPIVYWPFEDGSTATAAASAITGVRPANATAVTFAADDTFAGSAALATLSASSIIVGSIPPYTATGQWATVWAMKIPTEPAATTTLMEIMTTGTAARWTVELAVGTSAVHVRAYDVTGASVLDDAVAVASEGDFYGNTLLLVLAATQNGANVDYTVFVFGGSLIGGANGFGIEGTLAAFTCGNATDERVPPQAGLAGATFGHWATYVDATFNPVGDPDTLSVAVLSGHRGEAPWARFQRLCIEENIPYTMDIPDNNDLTMGPQGVNSLIALLRECETVEGCVMNDSGIFGSETGLLWFPSSDDRLNIDASMTLDLSDGDVATFQPTLDDQDIVNDVEVVRALGSSARVVDPTSAVLEGTYPEQVSVNTFDDSFLGDLAGWRVHLGIAQGMRFPTVAVNLRRTSSLAATWAECRLFTRVDITNPPVQYPPGDIQAVMEGYAETISTESWDVTLNLSPYQPYAVGTLAATSGDTSDILGWLDWDQCQLASSVSAGATSWSVSALPTDTTDSDDFPRDVYAGFELVTVTASAKAINDTFTRSASSSWGAADTGQSWTNTGGTAADFSVSGTEGVHTHTAANDIHRSLISVGYSDMAISVLGQIPFTTATGGNIGQWACVRVTDVNNYYGARCSVTTTGTVTLELLKRVAGTLTTLVGPTVVATTHSSSDYWAMVVQMQGSTLSARAWKSSATDPLVWSMTTVDTSLTAGTNAALISRFETGNTDVSRNVHWDNFEVISARTWTVTRSTNGVATAQPAGTDLSLAKPIILTM